MLRAFFLLSCFFLLQFTLSAQSQQPLYARVKIDLQTGLGWAGLQTLGLETDHGHFVKEKSFTHIFTTAEIELLDQNAYTYQILVPDVLAEYKRLQQEKPNLAPAPRNTTGCYPSAETDHYPTPANYADGSMGGYPTYSEMMEQLHAMHLFKPDLVTDTIALSATLLTYEGRRLHFIRMSDNANTDEAEPEVLYDALHHAREPNTLSQLLYFMWYMLENYDTNTEIQYLLNETELYFVPCVNPDGYIYNETIEPQGGGLWRKNRRPNQNGSVGVDLNRNYGYQWGIDDSGSSPFQNSSTYRGTAPFSEPETQLMRDFVIEHNFILAFNHHTYSNLLIFPWGYQYPPSVDRPAVDVMANYLTRHNNYAYGAAEILYTTNGDSDDWMYGDTIAKNKIYAFTPETGPSDYGFWPPSYEIDRLNRAALASNLRLAHLAHPTAEIDVFAPITVQAGQSVNIPFRIRKVGPVDGPIEVTTLPLTANVTSLSATTYNLVSTDVVFDNVAVLIDNNTPIGDPIVMLVTWTNGLYTQADTIFMLCGSVDTLFSSPDLSAFAGNLNNWNITADTEQGNILNIDVQDCPPQTNCIATTANSIVLPSSGSTFLQVKLQYSIEPTLEHAFAVRGQQNASNITPLCGRYNTNNPNTAFQPLYHGRQSDWINELYDLSDRKGENFKFDFYFKNGDQNGNVKIGHPLLLHINTEVATNDPNAPEKLKIWPQPASVTIQLELPTARTISRVRVWSLAGAQVYERSSNSQIDISGWANGLYICCVEDQDQQVFWQKLIVQH